MSNPKKQEKTIVNILDLQHERALTAAVLDYITIKTAISGLESELDTQKTIIQEYIKAVEINGIQFENKVIDYVPGTKYLKLDKNRFKLALFAGGIEASFISKCEESATDEEERAGYLKLRTIKKK